MSTANDTPRYRNLQIGERFERLVVDGPCEVRISGKAKTKSYLYPCLCDCGSRKPVASYQLLYGRTKSCGCLRAEQNRTVALKHGGSRTPLYAVWTTMIGRCENPNNECYESYGGRGIAVCPEWRESYDAFRDWALASGYTSGLTVERTNNEAGYSPANCIMATRKVQGRNKRNVKILTAWGETKSVPDWLEDHRCNASSSLLHYRVRVGLDHETAISLPPVAGRKLKKYKASN